MKEDHEKKRPKNQGGEVWEFGRETKETRGEGCFILLQHSKYPLARSGWADKAMELEENKRMRECRLRETTTLLAIYSRAIIVAAISCLPCFAQVLVWLMDLAIQKQKKSI